MASLHPFEPHFLEPSNWRFRRISIACNPKNCSHEQIFQEFPYIGQKCWVQTVIGYPLPAGLEDRDSVTVIDVGAQRIVVRNRQRLEWDLPRISLDTGRSMYLDGELVGEHHPKFAEYIRHALLALDRERETAAGTESDCQERISDWRWLLERNGFDPDEPPKGECPQNTGGCVGPSSPGSRRPVRS